MDFAKPIQALIPGTRGRVLETLARVDGPLGISSIARISGASVAQTHRVLPELEQLGIVSRTEIFPATGYQLSSESFVAAALRDLVKSRDTLFRQISNSATDELPGATVILYGSVARGDSDSHSDIDLVVVLPPKTNFADEAWENKVDKYCLSLSGFSGNVVQSIIVDADDFPRLYRGSRSYWKNVREEGIVLSGDAVSKLDRPSGTSPKSKPRRTTHGATRQTTTS